MENENFDLEIAIDEELPTPKKSHLKLIIILSVVFLFLASIAAIGIFSYMEIEGKGFGRGKTAEMQIEMGTTAAEIADTLKETGAIKIPTLFRLYAKINGYDSQFKYGYYTFKTDAGYAQISKMLITQGAKAKSVKVVIPEGTGINDFTKNVNGKDVVVPGIASLLEKAGICEKEDFFEALKNVSFDSKLLKNSNQAKAYYPLEGYLFADTYDFYVGDSKECAASAVAKMIAESEKRITDKMFKQAESMGYSMNEILTMASIVQMEAGIETKTEEAKDRLKDNMKWVAGVFYNRLDSAETGKTLGSSPTLFYGDSFEQDDGRYNTQADNDFAAIKGLPPGPLCSPSIDAINAALYPKESKYYYFVTDSSGNFYFHKTMSEQNATIAKLQKGQQWIYEYFD